MDFDIGTLVYILLTLIFLVVGALGKKKKENPQAFESFEEEEQGTDNALENFEKRFENFFTEEKGIEEGVPVKFEEKTQKAETRRDQKPEFLLDTPYDKIDEIPEQLNKAYEGKEMKDLYKLEDHIEEISRKTKLKMPSDRMKKNSFVQEALKDFNPRKAYLYSQIFKPKYF